jgi:transposase
MDPAPLPSERQQPQDHACRHRALSRRHTRLRIARKGIDTGQCLGRHRWLVERTLAWLNRFRPLTVRYERRAELHLAFLALGCALISFRPFSLFQCFWCEAFA